VRGYIAIYAKRAFKNPIPVIRQALCISNREEHIVKTIRARYATAAVALVCAGLSASLYAQPYPSKAIRWIVPFPAGGPTDLISRTLAQKLAEAWGQQVVIDNRPGAGGTVGLAAAAKLPADGYNIVLGQLANIAIAPALYPKLPYHPVKDFQPVTLVFSSVPILFAHPSFPARNVKELIALAKAKPGTVTFGSAGNGTATHVGMEMIKTAAGVKMTHVPYKGTSPGFTALMSGEIALYMSGPLPGLQLLNAGRVKALGVASTQRMPILPNVPTIAESGLPGYEITTWFGVMVPAGVPKDVLGRLHAEMMKILKQPDVQQRFQDEGGEVTPITPEQFSMFINTEIAKWDKAVRASGAKVD
jgi:tripartite-type tricarboxylate transporter receptor subunit TctC